MRVVFVRQVVHLSTNFLSSTGVKHILAQLLVSYDSVVDTQVVLLFALLLERIRGEVLVIPWLLPERGVTWSRVTMLPKLELHRGSSMEISSGAELDGRGTG